MTTSSRRNFLGLAAAGSALATSGILAGRTLAAPADISQGGSGRYVPPVKFGLGGVPLGNEFELVSDEDAHNTLEGAWKAGVRYYDVSPWYGLGLAERRYGNLLHDKNRDDYVLSSKVGKLLKASPRNDAKSNFPFSPSPNNVVFDYTADGGIWSRRGGQLRHIAPGVCRKQSDADDEDALDPAQQEMFPGLQSRYPAAHADDEEATYIRSDAMTAKDVTFNVRGLRPEGKTKISRADALEAWWEIKQAAAAVPPAA